MKTDIVISNYVRRGTARGAALAANENGAPQVCEAAGLTADDGEDVPSGLISFY